ncbi:hypothetical protein B0T14DRAFT_567418 [Immersiella caudata]|uniref:Uncharacterized protein n=1 Tax=Immersiella caudata TaxID=314043 RepID=A0AA39WSB6_9PEZI|nr:hypothetical protein B0T14DRAFT_567418 [Immersiella caudata]
MAVRVDGPQLRKIWTRFTARVGKLLKLDFEGFWGSHLSIASSEKLVSFSSLASTCGAKLYSDILRKQSPPNLSINIGRARINDLWLVGAVAVAVVAQFAVFVVSTHDAVSEKHALGFAFISRGTLMLFIGMLWCAALIEQSAREVTFDTGSSLAKLKADRRYIGFS